MNVFNQGDEPDNAYVIVNGECEVTVSFAYTKMGKTKIKSKKMCRLGNKSLFGELSLLFKGKRTATITTLEAINVLVIPFAPFRKYMRNPMLRKLNITIQFYRSLSFMSSLPSNVILILASKTKLSHL